MHAIIKFKALLKVIDPDSKGKSSTVSKVIIQYGEAAETRDSLSFDDIPGPAFLKRISKFWTYIPVFSNQVTASTLQYMLGAGKMFGTFLY